MLSKACQGVRVLSVLLEKTDAQARLSLFVQIGLQLSYYTERLEFQIGQN